MIARRMVITAGLLCLFWATWIGYPLAYALVAGAVVPGRLIDVRTVPAGDDQLKVTALFEYQSPEDSRTMLQGSQQVDDRLRPIPDPVLPTAAALILRQRLIDRPRRRIFLAHDADHHLVATMMADGASYGTELRQLLPLLLGGSLLLLSFGLRLGRSS